MKPNFLEAVKAYAAHLQSQTGTQAVIMPSLLKSEKFHVVSPGRLSAGAYFTSSCYRR